MKRKIQIGICLLMLAVIWVLWANTAPEVTEITVSSDRLPEAFSGFRIAHISDLHNAEFGEENERLLNILRAQQPDIIVITGDLVDSRKTNLEIALSFAREAVKIAPVYYATGNHEAVVHGFAEFARELRETGVIVLRNEQLLFSGGRTGFG